MATGGTVPPAETDATAEPAEETAETAETETPEVEVAMATISTRSLRVRALPSDDAEVVAGVEAGETYTVTGISADGSWIRIDVDRAAEGTGWVSADFVTLEGDITNIETVALESEPADTEESGTEEGDTTEGDDATAEPEPTAEPDEEAAAEATPQPTEEPAEEAAAEEEAAEEEPAATPEPTEEPAEESAEDSTADESAADDSAEDLGTVTISTDLPLRVRSAPTTEEDNKVGNVFDGDVHEVLEINEDGTWVRIAVPELDLENGGWVSAEFVIFNDAE